MRIFNESKTQELTEIDRSKGYLKEDKLLLEQGGTIVEEDIFVFIPYTPEELKQIEKRKMHFNIHSRIRALKKQLTSWDYKTSKHADGDYTDEEWAKIVAQRKVWREEIRALEQELEIQED